MLGNHPHSRFLEHFITHGGHPMATKQPLPQYPGSQCLETTNLLSLWIRLFWTFHRNGMLHYVAFCDWLLSHSVFLRSSTSQDVSERHPFPRLNATLFIQSPVAGWLGCFHLLAPMNACIQVFAQTCFHFSWVYTCSGLSGPHRNSTCNLWRNCHTVFHRASFGGDENVRELGRSKVGGHRLLPLWHA